MFQNRHNQKITIDPTTGEPHEGNGGYRGHRGGFEGMRQKGWTLITLAAILYHADLNSYMCTLLGQGDNQVICLEVPRKHAAPEYVDKYLESLSALLATLNLPLKPEETYYSSELFSYGKQHFFRGAEVVSGGRNCVVHSLMAMRLLSLLMKTYVQR